MRIALRPAVVGAGLLAAAALAPAAGAQSVRVQVTTGGLQTTAVLPSGGSVTLGGYGRLSEGRAEYGAPLLGRAPLVGRGFRNVGYGRSAVYRRVRVHGRVLDLREEEFRQTGFRSP
jgi:type II secretory pathway component GspD/PulD (secretin)